MPITEYKVVVGTSVEELTDGVSGEGLVPVGDLDPSTADYALQAAGMGTVDAGSVSDFEVVLGETPELLEEKVNARIAQGFQPVGGVYSWQRGFIQAVGKVTAGDGSTGGGNTLPTGDPYQVLGYDATGELKALHSGMEQWLGKDEQLAGTVGSLIPGIEVVPGQKVSTGVPRFYGVTNGTNSISIPIRDSGGILSANAGTGPKTLTNLKQVQDMIAAAGNPEGITGTQYDVASFNKDTGAMEAVKMSMELWTGTSLPRLDAASTFIPVTSYAAGGLTSTQGWGTIFEQPAPFSIPVRDNHGRMSAERAAFPQNVVPLYQVEEMIAASRKATEDGIIDIINGAIGQ